MRVYTFNGQEARGYWDDRGKQPNAGGWRKPVPGAPITSRFNPKRMNPVAHKIIPHTGTDFGAAMGTPIYSVFRGSILSVGPAGPCGNMVVIQHPNEITTGYCHMSRFANIKVGEPVGTHQLIGYIGTTGRSTGPHLHFFAKKNGVFFDAETLQLDGERSLPGADREGSSPRRPSSTSASKPSRCPSRRSRPRSRSRQLRLRAGAPPRARRSPKRRARPAPTASRCDARWWSAPRPPWRAPRPSRDPPEELRRGSRRRRRGSAAGGSDAARRAGAADQGQARSRGSRRGRRALRIERREACSARASSDARLIGSRCGRDAQRTKQNAPRAEERRWSVLVASRLG